MEPRYNEPLCNGVLDITNDFLYPSNSKIYENQPRYNDLVIANKFCQFLGPSLYRGSTVIAGSNHLIRIRDYIIYIDICHYLLVEA